MNDSVFDQILLTAERNQRVSRERARRLVLLIAAAAFCLGILVGRVL